MLNQLAKVVCLVLFVGVYAIAQDRPATDIQQAAAWNTVCPVEGDAVNPEIKTIRHNNKLYGFCGSSCAVVFADEPAAFAANLNEDGTQFVGTKAKPKLEEQ